jgi:NDP-sugar pyrophosphorylase family protein
METLDYVSTSIPALAEAFQGMAPWELANRIEELAAEIGPKLGEGYKQQEDAWIHVSARIHPTATVQGAAIVGPNCLIGPHAYLRAGAVLGEGVTIGGGCEIKSSFVLDKTAIAHLNYVGNSVVGSNVNIEAGAVIANHFNEREDKSIRVKVDGRVVETGVKKFGALVGDGSRVGANAVTTPGTVLPKGTVVRRLELVDQAA